MCVVYERGGERGGERAHTKYLGSYFIYAPHSNYR